MRITSLLFGKKTIRTSTHHLGSYYSGMVPLIGLEPIRILLRGILSPLCLPIPPQRRFLCGGRFICERPPFLFRTVFFCVGKSAAKAFEVIFPARRMKTKYICPFQRAIGGEENMLKSIYRKPARTSSRILCVSSPQ